jgi:hypothetical protein
MFNVYSIENQNFYLNNSIVSGIQAIDLSYSSNIEPSLSINETNQNYFISKPIIANFNLDYIPADTDRFIFYTGANFFFGKLEYANKFFEFSSGYLTNYSLNFALGAYPRSNVRGLILGELGNRSGLFSYRPGNLNRFVPLDNHYADLNIGELFSNRLESFGLNIDVPREAVYTIGNYLPDEVIIKYPISISLNLQFSMSEYDQQKITNLFTGITERSINLSLKEYASNKNILNFNLSNFINSDTMLNYSISDDAKLNLNLNTYILSGN